MQDFKNFTDKKTFSAFKRLGKGNRNINTRIIAEPVREKLAVPTGKKLFRLKAALLFIAAVLTLTPLYLMAVGKVKSNKVPSAALLKTITPEAPKQAEAAKPPVVTVSRFETANELLSTAHYNGSRLQAQTPDGLQHIYTIQGNLQQRVHDFLEKNRVPYGVFVAIEPQTGRILGMTSYSAINPDWVKQSPYNLYPMASLFKIITASAALETHKITPESVIEFRGTSYSENPRYWDINPRGKNNRMDLTYAMSKSINPVYGRVASEIAGKTSVMEQVSHFGFNQQLLPAPAKPSRAGEPSSNHGLRLMGAGLDHEVKISPLHAAVIMSAIANGGKMMVPSLTSSVIDGQGVDKEPFTPRELRQLVTPETSASLTRMLSSTVFTGTSRKAFHDRRGKFLLNVPVAAKTGSINGTDPKGHYSWFAAFAPIKNPRIALVALVINPDKWKVKASQVGAQALEEFFRK